MSRRRGGDSGEEGDASGEEGYRPRSTLGAWEPGFGATQGIGAAGEAIEVIGKLHDVRLGPSPSLQFTRGADFFAEVDREAWTAPDMISTIEYPS